MLSKSELLSINQAKLGDLGDYPGTTLHFGHGMGFDVHDWPYVTCSSTKEPAVLVPSMTLAVETYAHDGSQGVRF